MTLVGLAEAVTRLAVNPHLHKVRSTLHSLLEVDGVTPRRPSYRTAVYPVHEPPYNPSVDRHDTQERDSAA